MAITVKSAREIELMRESCKLLADVFQNMERAVKPGMSTMDINILGDKLIRGHGCIPNFLHYNGYPASICVSVNDEVVHGIPMKHHIYRKVISSAWMLALFTKDITPIWQGPLQWAKSAKKQSF